jgi:endonuclease/exonuclease/phosphatase family metal-dependent hydrolase
VRLRVLSWNLFHGRDFPPNPALFTWRSRLLRITERDDTHLQVNRDLRNEFAAVLCSGAWDLALLQECPPRWAEELARSCGTELHVSFTSRNSLGALRALLARINPDLIGSNEGGANATLVRPSAGAIAERRELALRPGPRPERRTMAFTRTTSGVCVANLHASTDDSLAAEDVLMAAEHATTWAGSTPLILGGDFNVRPRQSALYEELTSRYGFSPPGDPDSIDHILVRGLELADPAKPWPPEAREVRFGKLAVRLSDHAPVEAGSVVR